MLPTPSAGRWSMPKKGRSKLTQGKGTRNGNAAPRPTGSKPAPAAAEASGAGSSSARKPGAKDKRERAAAAESGGGGSLAECDPLAMPAAAARDQNMKDSEDW